MNMIMSNNGTSNVNQNIGKSNINTNNMSEINKLKSVIQDMQDKLQNEHEK